MTLLKKKLFPKEASLVFDHLLTVLFFFIAVIPIMIIIVFLEPISPSLQRWSPLAQMHFINLVDVILGICALVFVMKMVHILMEEMGRFLKDITKFTLMIIDSVTTIIVHFQNACWQVKENRRGIEEKNCSVKGPNTIENNYETTGTR
jgi:hypothetical protein